MGRRNERFLDRPLRGPAKQVHLGAGLVVRSGGATAAEGLLADHGAGGLVVDVEVAGGVAQRLRAPDDRPAVVGEDGAGQGVGAGSVAELERPVQVSVLVDEEGQHRAEELGI